MCSWHKPRFQLPKSNPLVPLFLLIDKQWSILYICHQIKVCIVNHSYPASKCGSLPIMIVNTNNDISYCVITFNSQLCDITAALAYDISFFFKCSITKYSGIIWDKLCYTISNFPGYFTHAKYGEIASPCPFLSGLSPVSHSIQQ